MKDDRTMTSTAPPARRGWRYWRNLAVFTFLSVVLGCLFLQYVGHPYFLSRGFAHPTRQPLSEVTPADLDLEYESVSFETADGLTLHGWYIPSHNGAAIMLYHPIASNRIGTIFHAGMLASHGYGVLMMDIRAHGESEGDLMPYGGPEAEDALAAVDFMQSREDVEPDRIGAMGLSLGTHLVILGAARSQAIRAVVVDGPGGTTFEDWPPARSFGEYTWVPYDVVFYTFLPMHTGVKNPVSLLDSVPQIAPRSIFFIDGEPGRAATHFYQVAGDPKSMWIIPGGGHIDGITVNPQEYEQRVIAFFDAALP
jgi:fermentation-respiration switch protein FrsA (DUF1100 family)